MTEDDNGGEARYAPTDIRSARGRQMTPNPPRVPVPQRRPKIHGGPCGPFCGPSCGVQGEEGEAAEAARLKHFEQYLWEQFVMNISQGFPHDALGCDASRVAKYIGALAEKLLELQRERVARSAP